MQIALTKKLADALKIKPEAATEEENPLFVWTANWITTWDNRKAEDMLVLVNNANHFTVAVYQVKRKDLKNVEEIIREAIINTLHTMNINPEIIDEYMKRAGEIEFVKNTDRKASSRVSQAGQESRLYVSTTYNGVDKMFNDTIGTFINDRPVNVSKSPKEAFFPQEEMVKALSELKDVPLYDYRAFELLVTLDLAIYKATRRLIVPADIDFSRLHLLLQDVFDWENYHIYDFTVYDQHIFEPIVTLLPFEEGLDYMPNAALIADQTLSEFFPKHQNILYRYDMGDNWEHEIELVRVIENHDAESPYLLEADGQAPPEDVGGVPGFLHFREIMLDPTHPEHDEMKDWATFWSLELSDWKKQPRVINE